MTKPYPKERLAGFDFGTRQGNVDFGEAYREFKKNPDAKKILDFLDEAIEKEKSKPHGHTRSEWLWLSKIAEEAREALSESDIHRACWMFYDLGEISATLGGESREEQLESHLLKLYGEWAIKNPSRGGRAKAEKDIKMKVARENAVLIWKERQVGKWPELRSDADFYRYIMDEYNAPKNTETVRRWVK